MADQVIENHKQISAMDKSVTALTAELGIVKDLLTILVNSPRKN